MKSATSQFLATRQAILDKIQVGAARVRHTLLEERTYDPDGPKVRLLGREATSEFEQILSQVVAGAMKDGSALRALVIDRMMDAWASEVIDPWAWNLDSGVWWPWVVKHEVHQKLAQLEGDFIVTERV